MKNARAEFIAICSTSYTFSVPFTDMQTLKFSSQICDKKKSSNFQNMHFVRVSCTFCQKNVQIVFSFSTCQIVREGWGGGGMITFIEHAHMFDATQIGGFGILTFLELAHMPDATQIGFFGMLTFFELAYMLMLRK